MPKKVPLSAEGFHRLEEDMKSMGFRPISSAELRTDFKRLGLRAPRPRPGREVGFIFYANGLTVRVWTSWLRLEGALREEDAGWVLIAEGDEAQYFSHPIHRTKNFRLNLLRAAWIAKRRVLRRPLCPRCQKLMKIARGKALKARYWICSNREQHESKRAVTRDWDQGLPLKARRYVISQRRKRRKAREKRERELGQPSTRAVLTRKPWQRTATG